MHHSLMHPCSSDESNCCGNARTAPFLLRYESFFHSQNALLVLAYEVGCPVDCLTYPTRVPGVPSMTCSKPLNISTL